MRRSLILGGIFILLAIVMTACTWQKCGPKVPGAAPTNLSPHGESTVADFAPNLYLRWRYPYFACHPDFFELYLWTGVEPKLPGMKVRVPHTPWTSGRWQAPWGVPLLPGKTYHWRVYSGMETGPGPDFSGPSTQGYFLTGPECPPGATYQPVQLLNPPDKAIITSESGPILFAWDDPTGCLVDNAFELQIWSRDPEIGWDLPNTKSLISTLIRTPEQLGLEHCHQYYWRIKTDPAGSEDGPFSEPRSFVTNFHGYYCAIIDEKTEWVLTFPKDMLCRLGPGLEFGIHRPLREGERVNVEGRSRDPFWWYLVTELQDRCWVPDGVIDRIGDWELLPILEPDPQNYKPTCPTESLLAPVLNTPTDGQVLTDNWPTLTWTYPDSTCDPAGYRIDLSVDPTFADTSLSGGTGNPSTAWASSQPLPDCQRYYWRVAGINDTTLGPNSETRSFVINLNAGLCPLSIEKAQWIFTFPRDLLCREGPGLDYGIHSTLLQGEQVTIEGRNEDRTWWYLETETQRRCWLPDEVIDLIEGWERIPILEVELPNYKPRCPTDNLLAPVLNSPSDSEVITDTWLGELITDTWPFLTWTYPDRACDPGGYRIDLSVDPTFADISLSGGTGNPSTRWAPANPLQDCQVYHWRVAGINDITLGPFSESWSFRIDAEHSCLPLFRFTRNAFCRLGPGQAYKERTGVTPGELVEVIGRNQDNTWWYIFWGKQGVRCWVSDVTGVIIGSPGLVPVVEVDPPVVETPIIETPEVGPPPACSRHTDSRSCSNDPLCRWVIPATGGPAYCTEK